MSDLFSVIATIALLCFAMVAQPKRASCPDGWWVDGVSPSGVFGCAFVDRRDRREWPPLDALPIEVGSRIYCTGGARPVVVDSTNVGCQR